MASQGMYPADAEYKQADVCDNHPCGTWLLFLLFFATIQDTEYATYPDLELMRVECSRCHIERERER